MSLGHLPEEVDRCDEATLQVLFDNLVDARPGIVDQYHGMHDFLEDLDWCALWVDLIEESEDVVLEEMFLMEGHWIFCGVVSCIDVVFECGGDHREQMGVG